MHALAPHSRTSVQKSSHESAGLSYEQLSDLDLQESLRIDLADPELVEQEVVERLLHVRCGCSWLALRRMWLVRRNRPAAAHEPAVLVEIDLGFARIAEVFLVHIEPRRSRRSDAAMLPTTGSLRDERFEPSVVDAASRGAMYISTRARRTVDSTLGCAQSSGRVGCSAHSCQRRPWETRRVEIDLCGPNERDPAGRARSARPGQLVDVRREPVVGPARLLRGRERASARAARRGRRVGRGRRGARPPAGRPVVISSSLNGPSMILVLSSLSFQGALTTPLRVVCRASGRRPRTRRGRRYGSVPPRRAGFGRGRPSHRRRGGPSRGVCSAENTRQRVSPSSSSRTTSPSSVCERIARLTPVPDRPARVRRRAARRAGTGSGNS